MSGDESGGDLRLVIVGDVQPDRKEPETLFQLVRSELAWGDLRLCQLECTISDRGVVRTDVRNPAHRVAPHNLRALTVADFDVVSYAGNNNLDYGLEAFDDTLDRLRGAGIAVVGAGADLDAATSPVYVSRNGTTVAFVDFCSILRDGFAARRDRAGISPLRVATFYEPLENIYEQPGTPSRTRTVVDPTDLARAVARIGEARAHADVVVACFHWGVHFTHDLAEYQPHVAYMAIEAGADLVVGTHPHCLQAVDVHRGRCILYSLGNFAFEQAPAVAEEGVREYLSFYGIPMEGRLPSHPHPRHCRLSAMARIEIHDRRISRVSLVPTYFNDDGRPEALGAAEPVRAEICTLMQTLSAETGTRLVDRGGVLEVDLESGDGDARAMVGRHRSSYPWLQRLVVHGPDNYVLEQMGENHGASADRLASDTTLRGNL
jgi:poly-gamma-glutamate capsule biosynthesis protein CapA/YwtB (metallophosphatase superfamily)